MKRSGGILCHISSLPSAYGIGTMGAAAYAFLDFLKEARQRYWQVLPLGPTGFGDSPYQSSSAFAGNPYYIDLELLADEGLLDKAALDAIDWGDDPANVDYGKVYEHRQTVLHEAYLRGREWEADAVRAFYEENRDWLDGFALYSAVKVQFSMRPWNEWDEDIRMRKPEAVEAYRVRLADEIQYHIFVQYLFFRQWNALRNAAAQRGISVIGDIPIYVPYDSADVWEHPELFRLDEERRPVLVAGVPPDYFSATGQLWGNPVYAYERMAEDGYLWWRKRMRAAARLFDVVRIDHFRGIDSYWAVPFGEETAICGEWLEGPKMSLVNALKAECPSLQIIAEDLGYLTPSVKKLLSESGFPGMRVLEFGLHPGDDSIHLPHNLTRHAVYYTGTHDNDTAAGWLAHAPAEDVGFAVDYLNLTEREGMCFGMARGVWASIADLAIVQIQDVMELPGETRMNTPGTAAGNWRFRLQAGMPDGALARRIAHYMRLYGRA